MAKIVWDGRFSVGNSEIDIQHQMLVKLINQLHDAVQARREKHTVLKVLDSLAYYTSTHFAAEERFMREIGYPGYSEHKRTHDQRPGAENPGSGRSGSRRHRPGGT